jgi:hypothetical protein
MLSDLFSFKATRYKDKKNAQPHLFVFVFFGHQECVAIEQPRFLSFFRSLEGWDLTPIWGAFFFPLLYDNFVNKKKTFKYLK